MAQKRSLVRASARAAGALFLGSSLTLSAGACSGGEEPQAAQATPTETEGLLPRRPIDGLHGIETRSALRYVGAAEEARAFEAVYVFPDRARWEFALASGESRRIYRAGKDLFYSQDGPSQPLGDAQRDRLFGQLELRRALLLWPAGFDWKPMDDGLEADLGLPGRLRASVDPESKLPTLLALHAPDGTQLESFRALTWRMDQGRRWPLTLQFWHGGSHLWDETFERVTPARYVDSFFTPADRREQQQPEEPAQGLQALQPFTSLRLELPAGTSWKDAFELERVERESWAKKLSEVEIAARPTFVLGETGRPVAALLRIEPPLAAAPKGWEQQPARQGIASFASIETLEQLDRDRIRWLRGQVPEAARPGAPYVRVDREAGRVQLVQPFEP